VQVNAEQAQRDIPTLIESQWRAMENARAQVLGSGSAIALADEQLKLARVAFQQAQGTSVDVTDAQLNLAKLQIERLQAAHDYVMALARLLEACGQPQRLPELAASADVRLEPPLSE
jgi:outer membrane protein TolC